MASAGAHIFLGAEKQNRFCLPNTRFLLHQPLGGVSGQDYLGVDREYYVPTELGAEKVMKERLAEIRKARKEKKQG